MVMKMAEGTRSTNGVDAPAHDHGDGREHGDGSVDTDAIALEGQQDTRASTSSASSSSSSSVSEVFRTQAADRAAMKFLPVLWEGRIRRKSDWLPRWEEQFMTLDGIFLRLYESRSQYLELQAASERALPLQYQSSLPRSSSNSNALSGTAMGRSSKRANSFMALSTVTQSGEEKATSKNTTKSTTKTNPKSTPATTRGTKPPLPAPPQQFKTLTVTAVIKEHVGRAHGLAISVQERQSALHVSLASEIERVVWLHLLTAALEQTRALTKSKHQQAATRMAHLATPQGASLWRLLPRGFVTRSLLGAPLVVNLAVFYEAWALVACRKGNFADLLPCLHPMVRLSSNLPRCVPIAGEFHGREGALAFFRALHAAMDVAHFRVEQLARHGDLGVVTGWETLKNRANARKLRHLWRHELRFAHDGRIAHLHIRADGTAAAVAFGQASMGPTLALPHEMDVETQSCPPGELRVVCIGGERLRRGRKRAVPNGADIKLVLALHGFPHQQQLEYDPSTLQTAVMAASSSTPPPKLQRKKTPPLSGTSDLARGGQPTQLVGSVRSASTMPCKLGVGARPFWAQTLQLAFPGAVPGTTTCLFVEAWQRGMLLRDELVGCARINLAPHLALSASGSDEDQAACAVPQWFDLRRPQDAAATGAANGGESSASSMAERSAMTATTHGNENEDPFSCGRLQLSISFLPSASPLDGDEQRIRRPSIERLQSLHEDTARALLRTQRQRLQRRQQRQQSGGRLSTTSASSTPTSLTDVNAMTRNSSTTSNSRRGSTSETHTFTVASTKFRVSTRYQLIRAIGHGAYGVVIAASDADTGRSVAIKNIPKTFDDLVDAKRIVREIRLMRHLSAHANVVALVDLERPPSLANFDDTYIVTELMETDLHRVISSAEPLSCDHVAYITYQMLCALRFIHSARVLHRDIKPSNILINRDCLVKICDFGLARGIDTEMLSGASTPTTGRSLPLAQQQEQEQPHAAQDESIEPSVELALTEYVVTRWYRAPELLLASKYTPAIDVWAVGCILVEMFTRQALFPGHDHVHQLTLILQTVGPSADDNSEDVMGFITNAKARRWMAKQKRSAPSDRVATLAALCPTAPPEAVTLMAELLQFDPRRRISVEEALAHPFLASYRDAEMEGVAATPFDFSFEMEPTTGAKKTLDKNALRRLIFEDVCAFHPEARPELEQAEDQARHQEAQAAVAPSTPSTPGSSRRRG